MSHRERSFVLGLSLVACASLALVLLSSCGPLHGQSTVVSQNGVKAQRPDLPLVGVKIVGSAAGQHLGLDATGSVIGLPLSQDGHIVVNAKAAPYLATGNGTTDDTLALRHALSDVCAAHGGTLFIPAGTYKMSPQSSNDMGALMVDCDYPVTIEGAGADVTILSRLTIGDTNPDTACPTTTFPDALAVNGSNVNRGAGIFVQTSTTHPRGGFTLAHLTLNGNRTLYTGMGGSNTWPATTSNCSNVWELSDKGVYIRQDRDFNHLVISHCHIQNFSGELIYGGSTASTDWTISDSELDHSNGDAVSVSAGLLSERNRIHDLAGNGYENLPDGAIQSQTIRYNAIWNAELDGIGLPIYAPNFYAANPPADVEVAYNKITNVGRNGIVVSGVSGHVHDNDVLDAAFGITVGIGGNSTVPPKNISVERNRVFATARANTTGITTAGGVSSHLVIQNNQTGTTDDGVTAGNVMSNGLSLTDEGSADLTENGNTQRNTLYSDTTHMAVTNLLLTAGGDNQVVFYRPNRNHDRLFNVGVTLRVANATTNVRVLLVYNDPAGGSHQETMLAQGDQSPGVITMPPKSIFASGNHGDWLVSVYVYASIANNVYVTAAIDPAGR